MTVAELIESLSELNPDARVRIAYQPNYPLWGSARNITAGTEGGGPISYECPDCGWSGQHSSDCDHQDIDLDASPEEAPFVYITTSDSQSGYASSALWA